MRNCKSTGPAAGVSGLALHDCEFADISFSQLVNEYQSNSGPVNTGTTPNAGYA